MKLLSIVFILVFVLSFSVRADAQTTSAIFTNHVQIFIPNSGSIGKAAPYPSNVWVGGLAGTITDINVRLNGVSHTFFADISILLVSPGGEKSFVLLSDCGRDMGVSNLTITFDDEASSQIPCDAGAAGFTSGSYQPASRLAQTSDTAFNPFDEFPAPAPQPSESYFQPAPTGTATLRSTFGGLNPNGTWNLYIIDKINGDIGQVSGGYSLIFQTAVAQNCTYSVNPSVQNISASGGNGSITVTTQPGCSFSSLSNSSFITITSGAGTGSGTVTFTVAANKGAARTGTLFVAGQTFTINQAKSRRTRITAF